MLRKTSWSFLSILMVAFLLLISCGPAATPPPPATAPAPTAVPTPTAPAPIIPTPTPTETAQPAAPSEKPKYGGVINIVQSADLNVFMPAAVPLGAQLGGFVYEQLTNPDWARGLAGSGEMDWGEGFGRWEFTRGWLAESWETPSIGTWIINVRKGVRFALDSGSEASRLANGREMTVNDVVFSVSHMMTTPTSRTRSAQPGIARNTTIEKTGPWQATMTTPVDVGNVFQWIMGGGAVQYIWAQEVVEKYGKVNDWHYTVGTGPYMLTDFVASSVATLKKNTNYWLNDPVGSGKGNQLPYPDGVNIIIIPDISTRLAAMRTGKADWIDGLQQEDAQGLIRTTPRLQSHKYLPPTFSVAMRTDKQELPYKDKRVRQALMLATDFEGIKRDYYGGLAVIDNMPAPPERGTEQFRVPFEQLPQTVQALYKYNPEKAKQLLAEAGYPNGFTANMIVRNTSSDIDIASLFKAMWVKVGVNVEIQPRDAAVFANITNLRLHEDMLLAAAGSYNSLTSIYGFGTWRSALSSYSYINDPIIEAAYQEVQKNIIINYPKADQIIRDLVPHILEQSYYIPWPTQYYYRFWQPWLKNYHGEGSGGSSTSAGAVATPRIWLPFVWIDQDLKQKTTGRR